MTKEQEFQRKQVLELRNGDLNYNDASIYTVLLDMVEGNGIDDVFMVLHNVASDLNLRDELEGKFEEAKKWKWNLIYE